MLKAASSVMNNFQGIVSVAVASIMVFEQLFKVGSGITHFIVGRRLNVQKVALLFTLGFISWFIIVFETFSRVQLGITSLGFENTVNRFLPAF